MEEQAFNSWYFIMFFYILYHLWIRCTIVCPKINLGRKISRIPLRRVIRDIIDRSRAFLNRLDEAVIIHWKQLRRKIFVDQDF